MRGSRITENPEHDAMRKELGTLIENAVDRLPDQYRIVFVMREIEDLTTSETARALEISEENVKTGLTAIGRCCVVTSTGRPARPCPAPLARLSVADKHVECSDKLKHEEAM